MSTIADVVKLRTGYANFVELKRAFEESKENADRMAMCRPTKAHRRAFERLCRGLYQPNDKKFYLLSGSYGTGMRAEHESFQSVDGCIVSHREIIRHAHAAGMHVTLTVMTGGS